MSPPRRQPHAVVNANRRARAGAVGVGTLPIQISTKTSDDLQLHELEGCLTQIQERDIDWKVPVQIADRDATDYDTLRNRINQLGPIHEGSGVIVTSNDPMSYAAAVNKRSNFLQDGPGDDLGDAELEESLSIISKLPELFDTWEENELDRERWLSKFDDVKRREMERAWLECNRDDYKEMCRKTGSVKIEVLSGKRFDKSAAGRIIYAGSPVFNAVTGPPQMVLMERLVDLLSRTDLEGGPMRVGEVEVKLGYKTDAISIAKFIIDERYKDIVEGDFSRNDREQRSRVYDLVDAWMRKLGMPAWYSNLMKKLEVYTLENRDFGIKVKLSYQLATGTTNTTFRNSVYNMTMFAVACRRQNRRGKALVLGDDILACLNKRFNLDAWIATVAAFKMVLKAKAPGLDGFATFLSRRFFAEVDTPTMIPLLGKMLVRFNVRANNNEAISDSRYMAAKALSYAYGCMHVHRLRDVFMRRAEMEGDYGEVSITDLGWAARSNGFTSDEIIEKIKSAPNLVDDDQFSYWCSKVYDLDICEVMELFEATVLSQEVEVLQLPGIEKMAMDYA